MSEKEIKKIEPKDAPAIIAMPPNILLLFIMAGIVLNWLFPLDFGRGWGGIGLLMFTSALGAVIWCKKLFEEAGTNISPKEPTIIIVQDGPYRYSRNPIYLGFLVAYAGLAMMANAPVMLLLLGPLWYILDRHVIAPEERYLNDKFGEEYLAYKSTKRRWL